VDVVWGWGRRKYLSEIVEAEDGLCARLCLLLSRRSGGRRIAVAGKLQLFKLHLFEQVELHLVFEIAAWSVNAADFAGGGREIIGVESVVLRRAVAGAAEHAAERNKRGFMLRPTTEYALEPSAAPHTGCSTTARGDKHAATCINTRSSPPPPHHRSPQRRPRPRSQARARKHAFNLGLM
jgi:hypothetical protein